MQVGKIYKIITNESNECYIGSTFGTLRERWRGHKKNYNRYLQGKRGRVASFDLFERYGFEQCKIILVKEYVVIDREHLEVYETLWIKKLQSINERDPCGGIAECLFKKERQRKWYEANTEHVKQKSREWYEEHKEHAKQKHREWREANTEHVKQKRKESRRGYCYDCQCENSNISQHYTSAKHLRNTLPLETE